MRKVLLLLVVCCVLAGLCGSAMAAFTPGNLSRVAMTKTLRTPEMLRNINKQVTVEGFFYDGSIPMVINDTALLQADRPLPADSYVPIVGVRPSGIKWGEKISVTGILERASGPLTREPAVLRIQSTNDIRRVSATTLRPSIAIKISPAAIKAVLAEMKAPYAVLIAGGYDAANSHIRYWNDLKAMYALLLASGYEANHIYVIYADGAARDGGMPVNYSASKANIAAVFNKLASAMGQDNDLYIMLNDHGCQLDGGHTGLCLWNHEVMSDTEFAAEVNKVATFRHEVVQMKQCFCGGFVDDLTKPNRVVMASASADQVSYGRQQLDFGEFTFWYMSALRKSKLDGTGSVNADLNGDGKVSIMEAWNYARANDPAPETPQYEDNGALPCANGGSMPKNGEGALGGSCVLKP